MRLSRLTRVLALSLLLGCHESTDLLFAGVDAGPTPPGIPPGCIEDGQNPPDFLECTGLYADIGQKLVAQGVREFAPAASFWSDGVEKRRWIWLPPGAVIDTSVASEWSFPVGTKAWKEFVRGGQRVETRVFYKVRPDKWLWATYVWKDGESRTERSFGETLTLADGPYTVPLDSECSDCHKGRRDKLLGFEALLLGLKGAQGVTLAQLATEGRLSHPSVQSEYQIGDDGTGMAAPALTWLHVNCGISCHNESANALGYPTGLFLRIDPAMIGTVPLSDWSAVRTTVGVASQVVNFAGQTRIVPGSPEQSLVVRLAGTRGTNQQMPPIATRLVDQQGLGIVQEWIWRLGAGASPQPGADAGVLAPARLDAGLDAGTPPQ